jgi:hypothetical protein
MPWAIADEGKAHSNNTASAENKSKQTHSHNVGAPFCCNFGTKAPPFCQKHDKMALHEFGTAFVETKVRG